MANVPADYDHRVVQVEAIAEALQELMALDGSMSAHAAILEAIEQWYDYHQKEASQWKTLKQRVSTTWGNG